MNNIEPNNVPGFYIPGWRKAKLLMFLYGAAMFAFGFSQLWGPLHLLCAGRKATAEAVSVVKSKEGLPDLVLTNDLAVRAKYETHDRTYTFWNVFQFHTDNGRTVEARASVGSQLKPLFLLTDADGLPTQITVVYDPAAPGHAVFPSIVSVWFAPGFLCIGGVVCMIIALTLYYWANKPIELPHIPSRQPAAK